MILLDESFHRRFRQTSLARKALDFCARLEELRWSLNIASFSVHANTLYLWISALDLPFNRTDDITAQCIDPGQETYLEAIKWSEKRI